MFRFLLWEKHSPDRLGEQVGESFFYAPLERLLYPDTVEAELASDIRGMIQGVKDFLGTGGGGIQDLLSSGRCKYQHPAIGILGGFDNGLDELTSASCLYRLVMVHVCFPPSLPALDRSGRGGPLVGRVRVAATILTLRGESSPLIGPLQPG